MDGASFNIPQLNLAPPSGANSGDPSAANFNTAGPGQERTSTWTKAAARSRQTRQAAKTIIATRSQFKAYLQASGLDLYTSAVEFQRTGDFIMSSYVTYPKNGGFQEPLASFLQRYPQLQAIAVNIRDHLRPVQSQMQIVTDPLAGK